MIVGFAAKNANAQEAADGKYVIGTLPAGFRPSSQAISVSRDGSANVKFYPCWVRTDGSVVVGSSDGPPNSVGGTFVFVAAS